MIVTSLHFLNEILQYIEPFLNCMLTITVSVDWSRNEMGFFPNYILVNKCIYLLIDFYFLLQLILVQFISSCGRLLTYILLYHNVKLISIKCQRDKLQFDKTLHLSFFLF